MHVRSGHAWRRLARRPSRKGDAPLGLRGPRQIRRSAALRSVVLGGGPGAIRELPRIPQFHVTRDPDVVSGRTVTGHRRAWLPVPVRAARVLLRRSRFTPRSPRVQQDRRSEGHVGQDSGKVHTTEAKYECIDQMITRKITIPIITRQRFQSRIQIAKLDTVRAAVGVRS